VPPYNRKELDSKRVVARLIDMAIFLVVWIVLFVVNGEPSLTLWLMLIAFQLGYFFMLEATVGQTFGKQVMGLKVARIDGTPAGIAAVATRTVFRCLEDNLLGLLVMVLTGKRRQRIGDLFARTIVTRASDVPGLAAPSPLVVIYPVIWIASAFVFTQFAVAQDDYLAKVDAICKERVRAQDQMPHPLDVGVVLEMSMEETRRIARLEPTPEFRDWHRSVIREKTEFERLGYEMFKAMQKSDDPEAVFLEYEPRLAAEAQQHNELFAQVGLDDCAR
jgi:uncharacterized RDD family membrane protein YckC